jgi:hypothetical protein
VAWIARLGEGRVERIHGGGHGHTTAPFHGGVARSPRGKTKGEKGRKKRVGVVTDGSGPPVGDTGTMKEPVGWLG